MDTQVPKKKRKKKKKKKEGSVGQRVGRQQSMTWEKGKSSSRMMNLDNFSDPPANGVVAAVLLIEFCCCCVSYFIFTVS
jgi:hypothetical protein